MRAVSKPAIIVALFCTQPCFLAICVPAQRCFYKIPKIIIAENRHFQGHPEYLASRGVELTILDDAECIALMEQFLAEKPELWHEDIGED